jgi:hypothetical protein
MLLKRASRSTSARSSAAAWNNGTAVDASKAHEYPIRHHLLHPHVAAPTRPGSCVDAAALVQAPSSVPRRQQRSEPAQMDIHKADFDASIPPRMIAFAKASAAKLR